MTVLRWARANGDGFNGMPSAQSLFLAGYSISMNHSAYTGSVLMEFTEEEGAWWRHEGKPQRLEV